MSNFDGTKTKNNLMTAYSFESQARNKYTFYARAARDAGYEQIAAIFEQSAEQEMGHAFMWFNYLDGMRTIEGDLQSSIAGENDESVNLYPKMAADARAEGFEELATKFELAAKIEAEHRDRFSRLLESINRHTTFAGNAPRGWMCRHCGFVANTENAPEKCPYCGYERGFFERRADNY